MTIHHRIATDDVRWAHCVQHFNSNGLILPELPNHLRSLLHLPFQQDPSGCFWTPGWSGSRRWSDRMDDWVARPGSVRCWAGLGPVEGEPLAELSLVSPYLGLFIRHRWNSVDTDPAQSLRVQGACRMAGHLLARVEVLLTSGCWPESQRLLLIDDGLDLPRWGWLDALPRDPGNPLQEVRVMRVSPVMYFDAMSSLDAVVDLPLDVLTGGHAFAQLTYTQTTCRYPQKPMY